MDSETQSAPVTGSALLRLPSLAAGVYRPVHVSWGARRGPADLGWVALAGVLRFENQTSLASRVGPDSAVRRRPDRGHGIVHGSRRLSVGGPEAASLGRGHAWFLWLLVSITAIATTVFLSLNTAAVVLTHP